MESTVEERMERLLTEAALVAKRRFKADADARRADADALDLAALMLDEIPLLAESGNLSGFVMAAGSVLEDVVGVVAKVVGVELAKAALPDWDKLMGAIVSVGAAPPAPHAPPAPPAPPSRGTRKRSPRKVRR